jgi:glycosyltransferase involved in cell wall biosynthesis
MKIAIVHDFLNQYGGAERCVEALHEVFPVAPVYTSIYLAEIMPQIFGRMTVRTSFMQKLPFKANHFKKYLMLYPKAMESFDLGEFDVILSSSSAFAKGVRKRKGALHISYCYSPMRFVWDRENYIAKEKFGSLTTRLLPYCLNSLRKWDLRTNDSVDEFIAIAENISDRIRKCYDRDSAVIYPPVNTHIFKIDRNPQDYFLLVSRLNAYKRIDLVIEAFNKLKLPLKIVGDGPCREWLQGMSQPNIEFTGRVGEQQLISLYEKCRAFIFPGEEDFGIAPVEAQAAGRPVIAFGARGALETVIEGVTGVFFKEPNAASLAAAVNDFVGRESGFDPEKIRLNALRFDKEVFKRNIREFIEKKIESR